MNKKNQNTKLASVLTLIALPLLLAACGSNASFGNSATSTNSSLSSTSSGTTTGTTTSTPTSSTAYANSCSGTPYAAAVPSLTSGGVCAVKVMALPSNQGLILSIPDGSSSTSLAECKQMAQQFQANYSNVCTFYISSAQAQAISASYSDASSAVQAIIQNFAPVASSN